MPEPIRYELEIDTTKGKRQIEEALGEAGTSGGGSGGSGGGGGGATAPGPGEPPKSPQRRENERQGTGNGRSSAAGDTSASDPAGKGADYAAQVIKGLGRHKAIVAGAVAGMFASGGYSLLQGGGSIAGKVAGGAAGAGIGFMAGGPVGALAGATIGGSLLGPLADSIAGLPMKFMQLGERLSMYNGELFTSMSMFKLSLEGLRFEMARNLGPQISELADVSMKILDQISPYLISSLQTLSKIALRLAQSFSRMIDGAEVVGKFMYNASGVGMMDRLSGGGFSQRLSGGFTNMVGSPTSFVNPVLTAWNYGSGFFGGDDDDDGSNKVSRLARMGAMINQLGLVTLGNFARSKDNIHGQQGGPSITGLMDAPDLASMAMSSQGKDATQRIVDRAAEGSALPRPTPAVANFRITDHIELQLADEERLHTEMMHILDRVEKGIWRMRDDTFLKISKYGARARSALL